MLTQREFYNASPEERDAEYGNAIALLAEKEKEIERLKGLVKEQMSERLFGIPYYGLSREQLMAIDGELQQALAELEEK